MFDNLRADMRRYEPLGGWARHLGFWMGATYRFGHWSRGVKIRPARLALQVAHRAAAAPWRFFRNVVIPAGAEIGPGLCIEHAQNILMPPDVKIGQGFTLFHDVTIGRGPTPGVPSIGDEVVVFSGAKVIGGITIGDRVEIGPNTVVVRDVDSGSVVSNPPPRAISRETITRLRSATAPADGDAAPARSRVA
jgi:serine O-acetyltransferase